jgi:hypothetical protein
LFGEGTNAGACDGLAPEVNWDIFVRKRHWKETLKGDAPIMSLIA